MGLTILHFDCFSGAAGDMILGALLDAGLPLDDLRTALGSLAIDRDAVWTERVTRAGISATKFHVRGEEPHAGHSHHHGHRTLCQIERLIDGSALSVAGRDRAKALFGRLAEAEAAVHGTSIDAVHLHEVGALDSIVDVVGTVYALDALGVERVTSSALNVGSGSIASSHGIYPVPAPATARLLTGVPIYSGPQEAELVTPTGALLVSACAAAYGPTPAMRLRRVGYGAGSRDVDGRPNVLRVLIGEADRTAPVETVVVIETDIDDMNPQIFGLLIDRLTESGALDVFYTPIQMKKNRPGTLLSIIAPPEARERLTSLVFRESTTIGVRYTEMQRECLDREAVVVATPFGPVTMKVARRNGEVLNASPEFDDCVRVAAAHGRPVKDVQAAAVRAFLDR
ncbi:MAG: nickel pincer cofactor biosynthesis protein LarC [Acidobacteria bacterium]|nr:nickel pincer cofactor biosynthesis protein LarC [Acidobacteriota bacterium]